MQSQVLMKKDLLKNVHSAETIAPEAIEHMLLECSRWQALRADILAQYINIYRAQVETKPPLLPASISMRLVGKLLGEELKLSSTRICKDPNVLCVKTTLATARSSNDVILSASAGMPYQSAKRTRLEHITVAKTGLIDP
ncbi:hypothetical protein BB561_006695, partial [Smittium simulii]